MANWPSQRVNQIAFRCNTPAPLVDATPQLWGLLRRVSEHARLTLLVLEANVPYAILNANSLSRPDGRPLFAYKASDIDFERLRSITAAALRGHQLHAGVGAAFVLFASEWWRRHFEGGSFAFRPVFAALNHPGLDAATRAELIANGLDWWRRPVRRRRDGNNMYLFSLVAEGGFPSRLLVKDGAHFRRFFRSLLEYIAGMPPSDLRPLAVQGDTLAEIGRRWAHCLPNSLRADDLLSLSAELVVKLWILRGQAGTRAAHCQWTDHLDQAVPDWRLNLPMRLDDAAATALLQGLLVDADRVATQVPVQRITWSITAEVHDSTVRLFRELRLPNRISRETMAKLAGLGSDGLPASRYGVWATEGTNGSRVRLCDLVASLREPGYWVADTSTSGTMLPASFLEEDLALELVGPNLLRHITHDLPGALGPSPQCPWVFSKEQGSDSELRLIARGFGSQSRSDDRLWMAIPSGAQVFGSAVRLDWHGPKHPGRLTWYTVAGTAEVSLAGLRWVVKSRSAQETSSDYAVRGKTLDWHQGPRPIYHGFPTIAVGDPARTVPAAELEVSGVTGAWVSLAVQPAAWGRLSVRHRGKDGAIRFQTEIDVAPQGLMARPTWRSAKTPGCWVFQSPLVSGAKFDLPNASPPERRQHEFWVHWPPSEKQKDCAEVVLSGGGAAFPFRLAVSVASPVVDLTAVDRDGTALPNGSTVHLAKLAGVRVRASGPFRVVMAIRVRISRPNEPDHALTRPQLTRALPKLADEVPVEVDLGSIVDDVAKVLAASSELDAIARVSFGFVGGPSQNFHIDVQLYDWRLKPLGQDEHLAFRLTGVPEDETPQVEAIRLANILGAREFLSRGEDGLWRFSSQPAVGTWLLLTRDQNWFRGRPLAKAVGLARESWPELTAIGAAIEVRNKASRAAELRDVLRAMGQDQAHVSWPEFLEFCRLAGQVPAAAFDVLREVREEPAAAALAVLLAETETAAIGFVDGLTAINFLWELVPLSIWVSSISRYLSVFPPDLRVSIGHQLLKSRLSAVNARIPGLSHAAHRWSVENGVLPEEVGVPPNLTQARNLSLGDLATLARVLVQADWQDTLRVHADRHWPRLEPSPSAVLENLLARSSPSARGVAEAMRIHVYNAEYESVALAPVVAALAAHLGIELAKDLVFDLWMTRDFAPIYFASQYNWMLTGLSAH